MTGWERHCWVHTHTHTIQTHTIIREPWGLSPARHWTLQGRQHLLIPYLIRQKGTLCSQKTPHCHFERDPDLNAVGWARAILTKLQKCCCLGGCRGSQVCRCVRTVTGMQFAQEIFWQTRGLWLSNRCFDYLSFSQNYVRCSAVLSLCASKCRFSNQKLSVVAEFRRLAGAAEAIQHTQTQTCNTHGLLLPDGQSACFTLKTSKESSLGVNGQGYKRPVCSVYFPDSQLFSPRLKMTRWWQKCLQFHKNSLVKLETLQKTQEKGEFSSAETSFGRFYTNFDSYL